MSSRTVALLAVIVIASALAGLYLAYSFQPPPPPQTGFQLVLSTATLTLGRGQTGYVYVAVNKITDPVVVILSVSAPNYFSTSLNPKSGIASFASELAISIGQSVADGSYTCTVSGSAGTVIVSKSFTVTVQGGSPPPTPTPTPTPMPTAKIIFKALKPDGSVLSEAEIFVDGQSIGKGQMETTTLPRGEHTASWGAVAGYLKPTDTS